MELEISEIKALEQSHPGYLIEQGSRLSALIKFHGEFGPGGVYLLGRRTPLQRGKWGGYVYPRPQISFLVQVEHKGKIFVPGPKDLAGMINNYPARIREQMNTKIAPALKMWLIINDKYPKTKESITDCYLRMVTARKHDLRGRALNDRKLWKPEEDTHFHNIFGDYATERGYAMFLESWHANFLNNNCVIGTITLKLE